MADDIPEFLLKYKEELVTLLHKSQDSFEKQLSYISAGSLALSIGFIKDVVTNIAEARSKRLLDMGWILLCITLLGNCISHIRAADLHNKTIADINHGRYDDKKVEKRYKEVSAVNWISVFTMLFGIASIVIFVSVNILK
ncbi:MAG TPA: hypothetical protein VFW07_19365 [Parafilimonas sp.]|nr:hypothetical protein [Parafilimonas sp.]